MLCFSKNNTDSVSVAPVRYPVVQISFKLHILNKRGWASEGGEEGPGGRGKKKKQRIEHACRLFHTTFNATCFRGTVKVGKNEQPRIVELLPAPRFSATLQQSLKHFLQQNHYNKLPKQPFLTTSS